MAIVNILGLFCRSAAANLFIMREFLILIATFGCFVLSACVSPSVPIAKNLQVSADSTNAAEPAVAVIKSGDVAVVWVEHNDTGGDVLVRLFDRQGSPKGDCVRVNPEKGAAKTWRGDPPTAAVAPDGTLFIGWTASITGAKGTTLYVSTSRDGGHSFEPPVKVNDDDAPASHGMHSLAAGDGGRVYAAWLDERYLAAMREPEMHDDMSDGSEPNAELYLAVSTDGGRSFAPNRQIATDACPCCKTSLTAPDSDGHMFIGWRQVLPGGFRHISVAASSDGGATFAQPVVVADDKWKIDACPVSGPSLTIDDGGALEVAWYAGGNAGPHGVYWTHSHELTQLKFSPPMLVAESGATGTPILAQGRVFWSDAGKLRSAVIDNDSVGELTDLGEGSVPEFAQAGVAGFLVFTRQRDKNSSAWLSMIGK